MSRKKRGPVGEPQQAGCIDRRVACVGHNSAAGIRLSRTTAAIENFSPIYSPLPAALFPSLIASASVMYLPFLVVP